MEVTEQRFFCRTKNKFRHIGVMDENLRVLRNITGSTYTYKTRFCTMHICTLFSTNRNFVYWFLKLLKSIYIERIEEKLPI